MGNQILGSDKNIRLNDFPLTGMFQSFDWSPAFNAQDIFELGKDTKVATARELETQGSFEVLSIGGSAGLLARMIVDRNVGTNAFLGYKWTTGNKNNYTLTQTDLKECNFDIVAIEKSDQASYDRAVVLPRCFLTSVSGRADANGTASETYNFGGAEVIGLPTPYHVARSIPATRTTSTTVTLADTAVASTTHALIYLYVDDKRIRETASGDTTTASLGASGVITVTGGGYTVPATARIQAIVYDNTSPTTTYPSVSAGDRLTSNFFVRGHMADVYIAPADATNPTANEKWLKVQSVDWNIDLRTEALRQISFTEAGTSIYCRLPTYPLDVTMNASVYESDWKDWKASMTNTFPGNNVYQDNYNFANLKETFAVVIQYRTKTGTLLQTWRFTDMTVDGYGQRTQVQGRAEISWTLRGTEFTLLGVNA